MVADVPGSCALVEFSAQQMIFQLFFKSVQGRKFPDIYWDFIPGLKSRIWKSFFDILKIIPRNLKISAESCVITGVFGSLLKFIPEICWTEFVYYLIGHNSTIKHEKVIMMKKGVCPFIFNSTIFNHGNGPVLKMLEVFPFWAWDTAPDDICISHVAFHNSTIYIAQLGLSENIL